MLIFIFCCAGISVTAMNPYSIGQRGQAGSRVLAFDPNEVLWQLSVVRIVQGWHPIQQSTVQAAQGTVMNDQQPVATLWDVRGQQDSFRVGSFNEADVAAAPRNLTVVRFIGENNE